MSRARSLVRFGFLVPFLGGCAVQPGENADQTSSAAVSDIASMQADGGGTYTVTCRDGRIEHAVTVDRLKTDRVCQVTGVDAMFDPASCPGVALTPADALSLAKFDVVNGKTTYRLGAATHGVRIRDCNVSGACGSWRPSVAKPALVARGTRVVSDGPPCPFAKRAPVLCGPVQSHTENIYSAVAIEPVAFEGLLSGDVTLELAQNKPWVRLGASVVTSRGTYAWAPNTAFEGKPVLFNEAAPIYKWATLAVSFDDAQKIKAPGVELEGKVTATCARWAGSKSQSLSDSAGNTFVRESQIVVFAGY